MKFGQTRVLQTANGKIAAGIALILFGAVAILAAPTATDRLLCGMIPLLGVVFVVLGFRQDKAEKDKFNEAKR